ncbi:MAG: CRISPR-associated endoribonuclease Cas6 [Candidatus Methanomethyliaceae archaeon]
MRIKIKLRAQKEGAFRASLLEIRRGLTNAVFAIAKLGDPEMGEWLHNYGWRAAERGPRFKFFSYTPLYGATTYTPYDSKNLIFKKPEAHFYIASPEDRIIDLFIKGATSPALSELKIGNVDFEVTGVEVMPRLKLGGLVVFKTLSPILISKSRISEGPRYLSADNPTLLADRLKKNALLRWKTWSGDNGVSLELEVLEAQTRIVQHGGINFKFPSFTGLIKVQASTEVIEFLYDAGLGEKTGLGFGALGVSGRVS